MHLNLSPEVETIRLKIRNIVEHHILPLENDPANYDEFENIAEQPLRQMRKLVKEQGLWSLQMPRERGGGGLSVVGMAACYEEMNRSIFGPVCFNCAAPDDGNMIVLEKVATEEQKKRWLQPIIDGDAHSSFAMTEPPPGAGS
ncbi:MAG: acyl-CoA dehydrogenase, partial [Gammaproteobacteria bacterium]|nr:acyl-CoA dehydrogenase [Gammaproteobacteria bacterium]